ncbi:uncharacterized protein LOC113772221 isoform X2 [Coffea eugenioides]|uniref:uncharacterized protein LOC113772221 isoform X2 n=1 Tax=Coffea eugenioides TaxID=49369 RepID=UPI000F60BB5E|nr:uncharacterized protein LOC113772221 isoform X2 [Coffea eugenioides]
MPKFPVHLGLLALCLFSCKFAASLLLVSTPKEERIKKLIKRRRWRFEKLGLESSEVCGQHHFQLKPLNMMVRLLRNASSLGCALFLQPLFQTYRKGLLGASTQLSYFSSKRRKSKSDVKERLALKQAMYQITASFGKGSITWFGRSAPVKQVICFGYCTWHWMTFKET